MNRYSKENKSKKFKKLAAKRTQEVLEKLRILSNCSNTQLYEYSDKDRLKIILAIEKQLHFVDACFRKKSRINNFKL